MKKMKKAMKNFVIVLAILNFGFTSLMAQTADKTNYVVVLDLSDRILSPDQAAQDIAAIKDVFARFEKDVRNQLIIKSNARFTIRVIPQSGSPLNANYYNELLSIDMSLLSMSQKRKALDAFSGQLNAKLDELYTKARFSTHKADYKGVDIWRFFNENMKYLVFDNYKNTVVVLTDGYFNFEYNPYVKKQANRYTSTRFLRYLHVNNWKAVAESKDMGLLQIRQQFPATQVIVLGIDPRTNSLDEREKLHYFWTKWLNEMNMKSLIIDKGPRMQITQILATSL
jgi:hypothetical protein